MLDYFQADLCAEWFRVSLAYIVWKSMEWGLVALEEACWEGREGGCIAFYPLIPRESDGVVVK